MGAYQIGAVIISFIIGLGVFLPKMIKARKLLKEIMELLGTVAKALEDGRISASELEAIVQAAEDIPKAIKNLKGAIVKRGH